MTLEPLLGSTARYRADVSWNTSSELSPALAYNAVIPHDVKEDEAVVAKRP